MTKDLTSMVDVRAAIDDVDRRIVRLLAERLTYIDRAAIVKQDRDTVRDEARIADVLAKVRAEADAIGLPPELAETVYRHMVEWCIAHEFVKFDAKTSGR